MIRATKKGKVLLLATCILHIINAWTIILDTYCIAKVMECVEKGQSEQLFSMLLLALVVAVFVRVSSILGLVTKLSFLTENEITLKKDIVKNMFFRPLKSFRQNSDAYYVNLLTTDIEIYRTQTLAIYPYVCSSVAGIVFSVFMLGRMNVSLALITVLLSFIPFLGNSFFSKLVQKYREKYSEDSEEYLQTLKETVEGCEDIRLDNSRKHFMNRLHMASVKRRHTEATTVFVNNMSMEVLFISASLLRLGSLGVGAYLVLQGKLSVAMLYAVLNYAISISNHFSNVIEYVITIRSTKSIADKLLEECTYTCETSGTIGVDNRNKKKYLIEYEDVSFSFDERVLFQHFCKGFEPGKCYAILGESGSGKSTLIKLLLKYYEEYTGNIYFCGRDIRECNTQEINNMVSVINQTPWLFNASLYENITMLSEKPEEETDDYAQLLEKVHLTDLAKRVGKSSLGDFGDNISGGERQRISLARAFRKHAPIMIFDEPTTGLDPENVQIINELIFSQKNITRIVITHDWSKEYLARFDEVIRL